MERAAGEVVAGTRTRPAGAVGTGQMEGPRSEKTLYQMPPKNSRERARERAATPDSRRVCKRSEVMRAMVSLSAGGVTGRMAGQ